MSLVAKYDVPAPRYTSYPTVPYWERTPTTEEWLSHWAKTLARENSTWALYLHIPFCETLCTFCGCNTIITKDHKRESPYAELLIKEWQIYLKNLPALSKNPLRQLHLGGGTPTFLAPDVLRNLIERLYENVTLDPKFDGSVEIDPRRTQREHLKVLRDLKFSRVSLGVQDFDRNVQRLVNRNQTFEQTKESVDWARDLGYTSINFDLIYGLPAQHLDSIRYTIERTVELSPDRIALYSFAKVPWIKPAQRLFKDEDLPVGEEKRQLYELARGLLLDAGYLEIGMDHFAKPTDSLGRAQSEKTLHRNFMGYTELRTDLLLGLGVSSISETPYSFHQNEKSLEPHKQGEQSFQGYRKRVESGEIPTLRGHVHSAEDLVKREQILNLMTQLKAKWENSAEFQDAKLFLREMEADGLVKINADEITVTEAGTAFLRNACVFFDRRLREHQPQTRIFSQSI